MVASREEYDVLLVGAGMSGLCALHHIRKRFPHWRIKVLEAAPDVGGTWYWKCYPGARFDSESVSYAFSFDESILNDWRWKETSSAQPDTLKGRSYVTRFYVSCLGFLSNPTVPAIPGIESFRGRGFHTSQWPKDLTNADLANQRIGVLGTGATGIQTITALSKVPGIKSLTVFQRTVNWSAPLHNSEITDEQMAEIRKDWAEMFQTCADTPTCFIYKADPRKSSDVTPEERHELNQLYSNFMADKIRGRVNDPEVAESLIPKDHGFGLRRVPLESGYFEAYNQPNVHLVDLKKNAIDQVTPKGEMGRSTKRCSPLMGKSGTEEGDKAVWVDYRPRTYLGMTVPKFPNMFMVLGPHQPFGNAPRSIEHAVDVIVEMLTTCDENGYTYVEPKEEAVEAWTEHVADCSEGALLNEVDSWMTGVNKNVAGKTVRNVARYAGSAIEFRRRCELSRAAGWPGLEFAGNLPMASL
ncbi:hypothetical protein N7532_000247 [Penicillium argentinense]|uniref:FAD/NAD(P)-binding domain-containing protein n=1 Tax=Penicillium argentinense TaxID=1131581 RepID=A0A9W9KNN5_9EURO|nr:uncharacterized protein N7532_000247 [Penicillium argentinense]KAJ5112202.1 hypothetical protein N7532_000247 [Penicillium argentinense]